MMTRPLVAALLTALVAQATPPRPGTAAPSVVFHVPAAIDPDGLEIHYLLRAPHGGTVSFVNGAPGVRDYTVETWFNGEPATLLRAYAYRPGFGFALATAGLSNSASTRTVTFEFAPLATVRLRGRIQADDVSLDGLVVTGLYSPSWHCEFFELMDCAVGPTTVAVAPVREAGAFAIDLPDFARDPALAPFERGRGVFGVFGKGEFDFRVGTSDRSREYRLITSDARGVAVAASYPDELRFTIDKRE